MQNEINNLEKEISFKLCELCNIPFQIRVKYVIGEDIFYYQNFQNKVEEHCNDLISRSPINSNKVTILELIQIPVDFMDPENFIKLGEKRFNYNYDTTVFSHFTTSRFEKRIDLLQLLTDYLKRYKNETNLQQWFYDFKKSIETENWKYENNLL